MKRISAALARLLGSPSGGAPVPVREAPWPILRNTLVMFFDQQRAHAIRGIVEVDVTDSLARLAAIRRELRIAVPFHAFAVHCVAQAVREHPALNTYRRGDRLITFEDVDILSPLDKRLPSGVRLPVGHITRAAQSKSLARINHELRQAIRATDLADDPAVRLRRKVASAPGWARRLIGRAIRNDPYRLKHGHGTVLVSTVQIPGFDNASFVIGGTVHTLSVAVGAITERLRLDAHGRVERRRILGLSAAVDHDVIDGMEIGLFGRRLARLLESGAGLDDAMIAEARALLRAESHGER
jgi:pyruvate/2-oxoglutarate dehydrogenase complex dihydrolipoamide acyltransferase (E2) component